MFNPITNPSSISVPYKHSQQLLGYFLMTHNSLPQITSFLCRHKYDPCFHLMWDFLLPIWIIWEYTGYLENILWCRMLLCLKGCTSPNIYHKRYIIGLHLVICFYIPWWVLLTILPGVLGCMDVYLTEFGTNTFHTSLLYQYIWSSSLE